MYDDGKLLRRRLRGMTDIERDKVAVVLYLSPRALTKESPWLPLLKELARDNKLSQLVVDEAHYVEQHGHTFRTEFPEAVTNMAELYDLLTIKCPCVIMSATLRRNDQAMMSKLLGEKPDFVIWTDMNCRRIFFEVVVSGNPSQSIRMCMTLNYNTNTVGKIIIYTNSKRKAEENLVRSYKRQL